MTSEAKRLTSIRQRKPGLLLWMDAKIRGTEEVGKHVRVRACHTVAKQILTWAEDDKSAKQQEGSKSKFRLAREACRASERIWQKASVLVSRVASREGEAALQGKLDTSALGHEVRKRPLRSREARVSTHRSQF